MRISGSEVGTEARSSDGMSGRELAGKLRCSALGESLGSDSGTEVGTYTGI